MWGHPLLCAFGSLQSEARPAVLYVFTRVCVLKKQMFLAEIELELRVFKYTWRRGLHECDPVQDGEQLWAVSCVGAFDCSVQSFHQLLPLSLRHSPLPLCAQLHFTHCNKAFILVLSLLLRLFCRTTTLQSKCKSLLLCQWAFAALWCSLMLF